MIKNLFSKLLFGILIAFSVNDASAQVCSVNAGVATTICESGPMVLSGNSSGSISTAARWAYVSGPNVPTITSPSSASTTVTGFVSGVYVFRYYATCIDATVVSQSVTITVDPLPVFTAGNDTFVCGNSATLKATLPAGATGLWGEGPSSNVSNPIFSSSTSGTSNISVTSGAACPQQLNVIWRVTKGACIIRDTALISFGGQTNFPVIADQTICGTRYQTPTYLNGCGGVMTATEISGPTAASISYTYSSGSAANSSSSYAVFSGLAIGTYRFATQILGCTGIISKDTFDITVAGTVGVTNPSVPSKDLCFTDFESTYYFTPTISLLPGETMTWNPTIISKSPGSLATPTATIVGNSLVLTGVTHPDTFATVGNFQYRYQYTVSNGLCSRTENVYLTLRTPKKRTIFMPVLNQACNIDTAIVTNFITGPPSLGYDQVVVLSKPATAPAPFIATVAGKVVASDLRPGKYTFSFRYTQGACDYNTQIVDVYISTFTGLANSGTDQKLPCGTNSTVLAGNTPVTGQIGTWQQVTGPSAAVLTAPNNPSLPVSGLATGTYTFRWSIAGGIGCVATVDDVNVIVAKPTIANAGPDATVCAGGAITLDGGTLFFGDIGRWKQIGGPTVVLSDSTTQYTTFTGSVPDSIYKFSFTVRNLCDTTSDSISITASSIAGPSRAIINTADTCVTASSSLNIVAVTPTIGVGIWSQLSGPSSATIASASSSTTGITGLVAGTYKFLWTVSSAGCDDQTDTVRVTYLPTVLTLTSNAGPDQNVCNATSLTLAATTPSPAGIVGTWSQVTGSGTIITSPNDPSSTVTSVTPGTVYDYVWTVSAGEESVCPAVKDSVHIIVSTQPSPAVAMADVATCGTAGGSLAITATAPTSGNGFWSVLQSPSGFSTTFGNATLNNTTVNLTSGITKIVWQVNSDFGGGCPANKDTVTFERIPTVSAGSNKSICNATNTNLAGSAPGSGTVLWTQVSGPSSVTFSNSTNTTTTVTGLAIGVYVFRYTLTHPTCGASADITVTNFGLPVAKAGLDNTLCWVSPSATFPLTADTVGSPNPATVLWSRTLGNGTVTYAPSASVVSTSATVTSFGLQQFLLTVANSGCTVKDYVDVFVDKPTTLGFVVTPKSPCSDTFSITASVPVDGYDYLWEFPTGLVPSVSGSNLRGPIENRFTALGNNKVYLTLTNPLTLCTSKDSFTVFVCKSVVPPIANNITASIMNSSREATPIPELKASNPSGTQIKDYEVLSLPTAAQGVLYYCTSATVPCPVASLAPVTTTTLLTPTQVTRLHFDPAPNFTGNVTFTYKATDTNNLVSNIATYTIPVFNLPPVTQNIRTAVLTNNSTNIPIPNLLAADPDGTVDSFNISSIPSSTIGVLKYCSNGTTPCTGTLVPITGSTTLTKAQGLSLVFSPASGFVGDFVFAYQSVDNNGNLSNTSSYTIPVVNYDFYTLFTYPLDKVPPVADNITSQYINNSLGATPIPNLNGSDPDGTTISYTIGATLPNTTTQGTLYYCASPGAGCALTAVTAGQSMTIAQAATLQFDPVASFIGTATFTYTSVDADVVPKTSPPATYKIPVVNIRPIANPGSMIPITNSDTSYKLLPPLSGYDVDGSVVSYNILSVPAFNQGFLQYCSNAPALPCTATNITAALANLTAAQVATIRFKPNPLFVGDYVFNFNTVDNNGQVSAPAAFTIPVIAFDMSNGKPPIANSFNNATINSTETAALTTALTGTDVDGTVVNYTFTSITPANEGVLTYCTSPPSTGCGTAVAVGTIMSASQAATLLFTPNANFTGVSTFNYVVKDNDSNISNTATVTIPVVNKPPVSNNINNPAISRLGTATTLNPLAATDNDGTVASYVIKTIPSAQEGVLRLCITPPSGTCSLVTVGQVLSPSEIMNLAFTPNSSNHSPTVTFLYSSVDNSGNLSNVATVNIPFFDAFPLPVNLISFEAVKKNGQVLVAWETGVESQGIKYELSHSTNGSTWKLINTQSALESPSGSQNYVFMHKDVVVGQNYYRLKIVKFESAYSFSPVRIVSFGPNDGSIEVNVNPNPMLDAFFVNISNGSELTNVVISNYEGRVLKTINNIKSGQSVDMSAFVSGLYFMKYTDSQGVVHAIKLVKE